ncbi:MAG: hypothetical protein WAK75_10645 [Methanoregula sp.]|uniref:hypothetical protein n=1 Tax=Methanoregula sp. TaxID=2052170 RepID=UPI003BB06439
MKAPRIPPMLATIVQAGLVAVDSVTFGERATCPFCGGPVSGYDTRRKVFAVIRENDRERTLRVTVKRFSCRACGRIVNADEPFYPGTRIGSPVIDLCLTLATMMPDNRTAAWLDAMDILVDRTSCRQYVRTLARPIPATALFGVSIPLSLISLSTLAAKAGERGTVSGTEVLAACGFPSAGRAPLHRPLPEEGKERDAEKEEKERNV